MVESAHCRCCLAAAAAAYLVTTLIMALLQVHKVDALVSYKADAEG